MRRPTDAELAQLGVSLREIDPATLHSDPEDGPVRWFLGEQGTELFAWTNEAGVPHHVQLVFCGVSVEWNTQKGLATGSFEALMVTSGGRFDSYLLSVAPTPDPRVCRAARVLLEASTVPHALLEPLLKDIVPLTAQV
jgi:hypothetical protein